MTGDGAAFRATPNPSRKREGGLRFAGYAAVFDAVDRGGDVVRAGAFGRLGAPVGVIEQLSEDARGLRVIGRIDDARLAGLVRGGGVKGLSFGYRVRGARTGSSQGRVRELTALDLIEVSLVAQPMQPLARVHALAIKSLAARAARDRGGNRGSRHW